LGILGADWLGPSEANRTVVSVIGDLTALKLYVAKGAPCRAAYATYTIATCRQGALSVTVEDPCLETLSV
jgi:hypothetical protein